MDDGVSSRTWVLRHRWWLIVMAAAGFTFGLARPAYAMHIAEGFLPPVWAAVWFAASVPFVVLGFRSLRRQVDKSSQSKMTLGLSGAFAFVLSALKMPSVTGSSSHPTGVALGAILFGPGPMAVLGTIVLLFQAIILAHGGLTTLGANVFSMAVVGPYVAFGLFRLFRRFGLSWAVFIAAALANLATYVVSAVQLALAYPAAEGGFLASLVKFLGIFSITQVPLAIAEGVLTVIIFSLLLQHSREVLEEQAVISKPASPSSTPGTA